MKFSAKITNGFSHECLKNLFISEKLVLMKIIFHELFWTTFLSAGVQRTDDRKEKIFFSESMFSLKFVFLKKFRLLWYDSSMGVHTHDDKNRKKLWRKNVHWVFFRKRFWITFLSGGVQNANNKDIKTVFQVKFFGYREIVSGKSYFEWFGKIYQRGFSGIM